MHVGYVGMAMATGPLAEIDEATACASFTAGRRIIRRQP